MHDTDLKMMLNFQKRMRETTELSVENYISALDTAIMDLNELKRDFGYIEGFDEQDWIVAYGTSRLLITIGYIRGMWDPKTPFRKNDKLTAEVCIQMGYAEQKELCSIFEDRDPGGIRTPNPLLRTE